MKALVLSLFIAFSGSIASATCSLAQGSFVDHNNDYKASTKQSATKTSHVAASTSGNSSNAGNADH